ncbi:MAG: hypothetical protein RJA57_458 [Bacteroidota bacterium]|jgi:hypothetical protein
MIQQYRSRLRRDFHSVKTVTLLVLCTFLGSFAGRTQSARISDPNTIGWFTTTGTISLNKRWSLHAEYQWRRSEWVRSWQQSLLRTGITYQAAPYLSLRLGYAWVVTFPYGEYPLQAAGRTFPEHRFYQMALLNQRAATVDLSHRFMLEQRLIGRFNTPATERPDRYVFSNRIRYLPRLQRSLKGPTLEDREPYLAVYDEVFIAFGKNVNENVFDQNRFGLLLGYRFRPGLRIEGGFFSQVLQLPREIDGRNVFQYNNGIILNTHWSF